MTNTTVCNNKGTWSTKHKRCFCHFQWTGSNCTKWKHHRCYFDDGYNYRGYLAKTVNGSTCALWTHDNNGLYDLHKNGIGVHNFCRNPGRESEGLWCYVDNENFFEYCNATKCPGSFKVNYTNLDMEIKNLDTTVNFIYGPLIIGLSVGMIGLFTIMVLIDCMRKKKYCFATSNVNKTNKIEESTSSNEKVSIDQLDIQSIDGRINEQQIVKPLGGVVTVNIDTGEKTYNKKHREIKNKANNPQKSTSNYDARSKASSTMRF